LSELVFLTVLFHLSTLPSSYEESFIVEDVGVIFRMDDGEHEGVVVGRIEQFTDLGKNEDCWLLAVTPTH
jgi:hypothetical protein